MAAPSAPPASRLADAWRYAVAALFYLLVAAFYLRPIWRTFGTHIGPNPGDPILNLYLLKWGMHQLRLGFPDFWNAPFFFPTPRVTTFSDHLLGPVLVASAFTALWPNPIAAYNFLVLSSFVLCGCTTCYVLRRSGLAWLPALLGGAVFAFAPFRIDQLSHLQMLLAQWIPLVLWSWDRLLAGPTWRRAGLFLLFYALHLSGSTYLAYMIHFPLLALAVNRAATPERTWLSRASLRILAPVLLLCAALLLAVFWPYRTTSKELRLARSESEIRVYGASLASFVTPCDQSWYDGPWSAPLRRPENSLFAGFLPSALALWGAVLGWRRFRSPPRRPLPAGKRAALAALVALGLFGWAAGEAETWRRLPLGSHLRSPGYHTAALLLLLGFGGWALLRRRWGGNWPLDLSGLDPWRRGLLLSGALCFLLAHPIVYSQLMRWIPGMDGMRVPARFYPLVSLALALLAALGFADLRARMSAAWVRRGVTALVFAGLLVELLPRTLPSVPLPTEDRFPPVYAWLAGQRDVRALFELPVDGIVTDISYMYFGTRHWKPLVNGFSGYLPAGYEDLRDHCDWPVPDDRTLDRLRGMGATHLLLHTDGFDQRWEWRTLRHWEETAGVQLLYSDDDGDRVYRLLPAPRRAA